MLGGHVKLLLLMMQPAAAKQAPVMSAIWGGGKCGAEYGENVLLVLTARNKKHIRQNTLADMQSASASVRMSVLILTITRPHRACLDAFVNLRWSQQRR